MHACAHSVYPVDATPSLTRNLRPSKQTPYILSWHQLGAGRVDAQQLQNDDIAHREHRQHRQHCQWWCTPCHAQHAAAWSYNYAAAPAARDAADAGP